MKLLNGEPQVLIMPEILNKIKKYTKLCEHSIYWAGKVMRVDDKYYIEDAVVIPQSVGKKGDIDYIALQEIEVLFEEEGYEGYCIGRTKKGKSVAMTDKDLEFLKYLMGEVSSVIYIQTNNKDELSLNIVDFDKGIIFDNVNLTVTDTEFYSDEEIMLELESAIEEPSTHAWVSVGKETVKSVEICESDDKKEPKQMSIIENSKEKTTGKVIEFKKVEEEEKVEYQPNQFVIDNIDFRELVRMDGDVNENQTGQL